MNFRHILPEDKTEYERHYQFKYRIASDASFTTAYSWAEAYKTKIIMKDDVACLIGNRDAATPYFMMPVGPGDREKFLKELYLYCKDSRIPFSLHWALLDDIPFIQNIFGDKVHIASSRDSADYIYETKTLISLSGKKLHAKRNHVNTFRSKYIYSFSEISESNLGVAEAFVIKHCKTEEEKIAMLRLFQHYFYLKLTGMILFVGENVAAVTVGEKISHDTALIHLEKADTSFLGVYPAVNQIFVSNFFPETQYINREEDMGIEGLRKAKLSYRPIFLLEKFTVTEADV